MALVKCRECGNEISSSAPACPKCGKPQARPKKETGLGTWVVGGFMAFVIGSCIISTATRSPSPEPPPSTPAKTDPAKDAADAQRSRELNRASLGAYSLRGAAKVPSSFEVTSADFHSDGTVCYEYESRNSFNALLKGRAVLAAGADGLLSQEQHGSRFVRAWNKTCTQGDFENYTRDVQAILKMTPGR